MPDTTKNIVFIGLPGSGKTTVSKLAAQSLSRPWFDSDAEIEAEEQMSISALFAAKGEAYFRERETECISRLLKRRGIVLAVGGGAVLKNGEMIRQNNIVIYINRSVRNILTTIEPGTRPLLADTNRLAALYAERSAIYEQLCDFTVINDSGIEDAVKKVLELRI